MSGGSDEGVGSGGGEASVMRAQRACATALAPLCGDGGLVLRALDLAMSREGHVMAVGASQLLESTLALLSDGLRRAIESGAIGGDGGAAVVVRRLLLWSLAWGAGGPLPHASRAALAADLATLLGDREIGQKGPGVLECEVRADDGEWAAWQRRVPQTEVPTAKAAASDVVVRTLDTVRLAAGLGAYLRTRRPLLLCGPPGCGKTLTLSSLISWWAIRRSSLEG